MKALTKAELQQIDGGIAVWGVMGIIGGITFIIGVLDGFIRPLKCN